MYVITRPERGGAQTHVLELLRGLPDPTLATLVTGNDRDLFLIEEARLLGARTVILPELTQPLSPRKDFTALWSLFRMLRQERPRVVHAHSSKAGLLTRLAARIAGVPSVFTAHGWAFTDGVSPRRQRLALTLERLVGRLGQVITVSEFDRRLALSRGVGRANDMVAIHNALPNLFVPQARAPEPDVPLRVMMVARFSDQKDQSLLLRAAAQVPQVRLVLVGDGPQLEAARALADHLGVQADFLGSRADVPELLASAHVFALISHFEGFPISTLEAMRAGLPVLLSDVGGSGEALGDGEPEAGIMVPRGDEEALVTALRALAADPEWVARLGRGARAVFLQRFTADEMLRRTWAVYDRAAAGTLQGK